MTQQPASKASNWIIIPKNELREIFSSQETGVEATIRKIEDAGEMNPGALNYVIIPDGEMYAPGAFAFATNNSADTAISNIIFACMQRHPRRKQLTLEQADDLHTRLFLQVQESVLAIARAHAEQQTEKAMDNENLC